ncbi:MULTISPECIES: hypothetical protein [Bradyrhizobium]|uniref:hypothetical protein n=1 Tax=Bradyrhizobium TaxID=374 RepID=UPI0004BC1D8A|nr:MULTISPECIES: hypothetical protein [Bradyrhizobium]MBR0945255.1 hypothetical protein [Bradyrhizobium liaoningense]
MGDEARTDPTYQEALTKLIPIEVVTLYLGGKNAIEGYYAAPGNAADGSAPLWWWGWTIVCIIGLVVYRGWATSDSPLKVPPDVPAVIVALVSFVIWIYSFGDAFRAVGWWHPLLAALLVVAWTFAAPHIFLKWMNSVS